MAHKYSSCALSLKLKCTGSCGNLWPFPLGARKTQNFAEGSQSLIQARDIKMEVHSNVPESRGCPFSGRMVVTCPSWRGSPLGSSPSVVIPILTVLLFNLRSIVKMEQVKRLKILFMRKRRPCWLVKAVTNWYKVGMSRVLRRVGGLPWGCWPSQPLMMTGNAKS